jgi:hypothetical protein
MRFIELLLRSNPESEDARPPLHPRYFMYPSLLNVVEIPRSIQIPRSGLQNGQQSL